MSPISLNVFKSYHNFVPSRKEFGCMSSYGDLIANNKLLLVDFFATWCGPCQTLGPILEDVAKQTSGKVKIVKVDIDKNQSLATKLNVKGVPTMILYKNGNQVWRQSGVVPVYDLVSLIELHS